MTQKIAREVANAARSLCGIDFRLHGREPASGLDCIGLAEVSLESAGIEVNAPNGYSIRGGEGQEISKFFHLAGFESINPDRPLQEGDVVLVRPHPAQWHFMIWSGEGFIHAHAGIGKVVHMPGNSPWPIKQIFRLPED